MCDFRGILKLILAIGVMLASSGCAVVMATRQPDKKDLGVFKKGSDRSMVIGEVGKPISSEQQAGKKIDLYKFAQGYSTVTKAGRALFHGAADVFTLGMWEAVGTPAEAILHGREMLVKVIYNESDKIEKVELLKGDTKQLQKFGVIQTATATETH